MSTLNPFNHFYLIKIGSVPVIQTVSRNKALYGHEPKLHIISTVIVHASQSTPQDSNSFPWYEILIASRNLR